MKSCICSYLFPFCIDSPSNMTLERQQYLNQLERDYGALWLNTVLITVHPLLPHVSDISGSKKKKKTLRMQMDIHPIQYAFTDSTMVKALQRHCGKFRNKAVDPKRGLQPTGVETSVDKQPWSRIRGQQAQNRGQTKCNGKKRTEERQNHQVE